MLAPAALQAKHETVRTTRVWCSWAALMIEVILELVQPAQPVVAVPLLFRLSRLPVLVQPTLK